LSLQGFIGGVGLQKRKREHNLLQQRQFSRLVLVWVEKNLFLNNRKSEAVKFQVRVYLWLT